MFGFGDNDEMEVDVTSLSAADAARKIVTWFERRQSEPIDYDEFLRVVVWDGMRWPLAALRRRGWYPAD